MNREERDKIIEELEAEPLFIEALGELNFLIGLLESYTESARKALATKRHVLGIKSDDVQNRLAVGDKLLVKLHQVRAHHHGEENHIP